MKKALFIALCTLLAAATVAAAEEPYTPWKTGVQIGTIDAAALFSGVWTTSFGVEVHVTPAISVKALALFSTDATSYAQASPSIVAAYTTDASAVYGGGLDVLWHPIVFSTGSIYLGPAATLAIKTDSQYYPGSTTVNVATTDTWLWVGGVLGAQLLLNKHIALFAESGLGWDYSSERDVYYNSSAALTSDSTYSTWTIESTGLSVGFIIYLN